MGINMKTIGSVIDIGIVPNKGFVDQSTGFTLSPKKLLFTYISKRSMEP